MPIGMPGMAAVGGLDRVHREGADGVGEAAVGRLHGAPAMGFGPPGTQAGDAAPLSGEPCRVNACPESPNCVAEIDMDDARLSAALDRAERALQRIERALAERARRAGRPRRGAARQGPRGGRGARRADPRGRRLMADAWSTSTSPGAPTRSPAARARRRICAPRRGWSTARAARRWPGSARCREARQFLFASLLLADQLIDKQPEARRRRRRARRARPGARRARRSARRPARIARRRA